MYGFASPKFRITMTGIALASVGYIFYEHYKSYQVQTHPTFEMAQMVLKQDKRVSNFCGKNYNIYKYRMISQDDNNVAYRVHIEGIRGNCRVLVKCQKHTHAELKAHSLEQIQYSKKSKEDKASSTFVPINFNDLIIPTGETFKKVQDLLKSKSLPDEILIFNRENYLKGDYHAGKEEVNKVLKKPIENADTFYRITSMVMVANDNLVFNIRPIGPKFRDYDIEDTMYTYRSYEDMLKKLMNARFEYNEALQEDVSAEEFRNEIILYKQTKFQQRTQQRKYVTIFNMVVFVGGYFVSKMVLKQKIDYTTLKSLQSKILNLGPKTPLGNNHRLIAIDYNFSPIQQKFNISGLAMGEKGALCGIETSTIIEDISPHSTVTLYSLNPTTSTSPKSADVKDSKTENVKISI
jgi:hypothetical protein